MYQDGILSWLVWFKMEAQQRRQVNCGPFGDIEKADTPVLRPWSLRLRREVNGSRARTLSYYHPKSLSVNSVRFVHRSVPSHQMLVMKLND